MSYLQCRNEGNASSPLEAIFHEEFLTPFLSKNFYPSMDIAEHKDRFVLDVDLPGLKKEDIVVAFDNGILSVSGQRIAASTEDKEGSYQRIERSYGKFNRSVQLGLGVDSGNIKAQYKDGVLQLTVPKLEKSQTKVVNIE